MCDIYRTIQSPVEGIYKEKGSRFLSFAYPVSSEDEIRDYLAALKKQFHDARHHCYAWRLEPEKTRYRVNDDGEPSGSAGKPIYGQIVSRDLTDILVVVVRYFGGTKLGVGGLTRAYRDAASDALEQGRILTCKVMDRLKIEFTYEQMDPVMKTIKEKQLDFENMESDRECSMIIKSWKRNTTGVVDSFSKIAGCKIRVIQE